MEKKKLQINKKKVLIWLFALLIVAGFAFYLVNSTTFKNFKLGFFGDNGVSSEKVEIAVYEPFSGADSRGAAAELRGIQLAHELYPEVLGKKVELVNVDNRSDLTAAQEAAQEIVLRAPKIVLGSYGSVYSLAAASYFEEAEIPAVSITNVNPIVTENNPLYISISYSEDYEAVALAKYAHESLKAIGIASLYPVGDQVAQSHSKAFEEKMIQLSGNIKIMRSEQSYPVGTEEYSEYLMNIKRAGAQAVFLPVGTADALKIIRQARELGIRSVFLGPSSWDEPAFAGNLGEKENAVVFPTAFDPRSSITEMTDIFIDAYHEKYGQNMTPVSAEAMGFDAYLLALSAIENAGIDARGKDIIESVIHNRGFQGASGSISFDTSGSAIKSVIIKSASGGVINSIYTVEPNWVNIE